MSIFRPRAKLRNLTVDRVDLVDAGANPDAAIALFKREVSPEERDRMASAGHAMPDGSFPIETAADLKNAVQAFGRAKNPGAVKAHIMRRARAMGMTDMMPEEWMAKEFPATPPTVPDNESSEVVVTDRATLPEDVRKELEDLESRLADVTRDRDETKAKLEKGAEPPAEPEVEVPEPVAKALEAAKTAEAEAVAKAAALEDRVAKMERERRRSEFVSKAQAEMPNIGTADELVDALMDVAEKAADAYPVIERTLKAASEQIAKGSLFKEIGSQGAEGEVDEKITALAKAHQAANPGLTIEQAKLAVVKADPTLYTEYQSAERAR